MSAPKALTVRQPWASLIATGVKHILDQSKPTAYRGPLLIHAGKQYPTMPSGPAEAGWGMYHLQFTRGPDQPFLSGPGEPGERPSYPLPLGAVVASCQLIDCVPITDGAGNTPCIVARDDVLWYDDGLGCSLISDQLPFGEFSAGRFAWLLDGVRALPEPVPAVGRQGLWKPSDDVLASIERQLAGLRSSRTGR